MLLGDFNFVFILDWLQCNGAAGAILPHCSFIAALFSGLLKTLGLIAASICSATLLGLVLGAAWLAVPGLVRLCIDFFVALMRPLPAALTVLILFYATLAWPPKALPVSVAFLALWLALTLHGAAGIAGAMRRHLEAMVNAQGRAAKALGLSGGQIFWGVLLPQARRLLAAPLRRQWVALVHLAPLAVLTGYADLTTNGMAHAMSQSLQAALAVVLVWGIVYGALAAMLRPRQA